MIEEKHEANADKKIINQAFSLIKAGESIRAREILNEILSEFPECAEAYLGLLMLEVGVSTREHLNGENTPFNNSINYKNALKYADDELKAFLTNMHNSYVPDGDAWVKKYRLQLHDLGAYYEVTSGVPENYVIKIPPYYNLKPIGAIADGAFARSAEVDSLIAMGLIDYNARSPFHIELPATIRRIGERAFAGSLLTEIVLPDGLLEIGESAFADCRELKTVSFPINPLKLSTNAFANDDKLERINIKSVASWCESDIAIEGASPFWVSDAVICINDEPVRELTIPEGVSQIKDNVFLHISSITSLKLPNSLRKIGSWAFGLASNIESISFGDGLEVIEDYTFHECERLTEVTLPHTMKKIGEKAFALCKGMRKLSLGGVEVIGDEAFLGCNALSSLTIPASVRVIGKMTFKSLHIKSLTMLGALDLIDKEAFEYCEEIEEFTLGGAKVIGYSAFRGCKKIKSVIIPSGVEKIADYAFSYCSSIEKVELPDTIIEIGSHAFDNNDFVSNHRKKLYINGLENWCNITFKDEMSNPISTSGEVFIDGSRTEKLVIPTKISEIKSYAFAGFTQLKEVVFHEELTKIGDGAFSSCNNLLSIAIPKNIKAIGKDAFAIKADSPERTIIIEKGVSKIHAEAFCVYDYQKRNKIFYEGSKAELRSVITYGKKLGDCSVYYYAEEKKFLGGRQWRYVDGEPTPW